MDKQATIDFILRELDQNRSQEEITSQLCQQLGAPADLVSKFVSQVASEQTPAHTTAQPPPASSQPYEQAFSHQEISSIETPFSNPPPPKREPPVEVYSHEEVTSIESSIREPGPVVQAEPQIQDKDDPASYVEKPLPDLSEEQLEQLILKALSKNRRRSDIVAAVCERMNMNWDEGERLVARVDAENRSHVVSRQNVIFVPIAIIAILAGLALIYASVSEIFAVGMEVIEPGADIGSALPDIERSFFDFAWAITGVTLFLVGVVGLFLALRAQFD